MTFTGIYQLMMSRAFQTNMHDVCCIVCVVPDIELRRARFHPDPKGFGRSHSQFVKKSNSEESKENGNSKNKT